MHEKALFYKEFMDLGIYYKEFECNKKGHEIYHYTNILDLIKGVYRDVF